MTKRTRKDLPEGISNQMKVWRTGIIPMPTGYIVFHRKLAEARIDELVTQHQLQIHSRDMVDDGWFDGMRVRQYIVETRSGNLMKLKYHDGNQDFMHKLPNHCGAVSTDEKDFV